MANFAKYKKTEIGGMTRHFERYKKENGEYIKFGNLEIDITKSNLNYNLATHQELPQLEFINKRISEVYCLNRRDVNVMGSYVVTLPKSLEKNSSDEDLFFKETYNFLEKRYGKENVISAFVHRDETTPHIHFAFIPIIYDKNKEMYKVSAKEVVNRADLQTLHSDLSVCMQKIFKRDIGVLNEQTKNGNKAVVDLKKEKYLEEVKSLNEKIIITEQVIENIDKVDFDFNKKPNLLKKINLDKDEFEVLLNKAKLGELTQILKVENEKLFKSNNMLLDENKKINNLISEIENLKKNNSTLKNNVSILEKIIIDNNLQEEIFKELGIVPNLEKSSEIKMTR